MAVPVMHAPISPLIYGAEPKEAVVEVEDVGARGDKPNLPIWKARECYPQRQLYTAITRSKERKDRGAGARAFLTANNLVLQSPRSIFAEGLYLCA
jgi:hypothetical protein